MREEWVRGEFLIVRKEIEIALNVANMKRLLKALVVSRAIAYSTQLDYIMKHIFRAHTKKLQEMAKLKSDRNRNPGFGLNCNQTGDGLNF